MVQPAEPSLTSRDSANSDLGEGSRRSALSLAIPSLPAPHRWAANDGRRNRDSTEPDHQQGGTCSVPAAMKLDDLELSTRVVNALHGAGLRRVEQVTGLNPREVRAIRGIGSASLQELEEELGRHDIALAEDPYAPYVCARHGQAARDATLADLWLCDQCATQFESGPFDGTPPEFVAPPMGGHCVNCGRNIPSVRLRQWLLCGKCSRVARSFGKSVVAARGLLRRWRQDIGPDLDIELAEVDFPVLDRRTQDVMDAKRAAIDFEGRRAEETEALFGFEMKTGNSGLGAAAVHTMSQFQLDCSDCDDILTVVEARDRLPVYLLHAQVITRVAPPTPKFVSVGYWWTDLFTMAEAFTHVRQRPRETRPAAYFNVAMFRPLADFTQHVESGALGDLTHRLREEGPPKLYRR